MATRNQQRVVWVILATAALAVAPRIAWAQTTPAPTASATPPPPATESVSAGINVRGFVSTSYTYNGNQPPSRLNTLRVFDITSDTVSLDVAEIGIERLAAHRGDAGFRVVVAAGSSIPKVSAARGLFRDPDTARAFDVDLQQAFAGVMLTDHLRLDAGKFLSPLGFEVIEGCDGANDQASRSFMFGYAIPYTHTGVRLAWTGEHASALVMAVNGWDNAIDNNRAKTGVGQIVLGPIGGLSLTGSVVAGAEQTGNNRRVRTVYDATLSWHLPYGLSIGINGDDGREAGAAADGGTARWRGAAAYARIGLGSRVAIGARGEVFDDRHGTRTGIAQTLTSATLTPEFRLASQVLVRFDVRVDRSNRSVFESRSGTSRRQPTIQFNFVGMF